MRRFLKFNMDNKSAQVDWIGREIKRFKETGKLIPARQEKLYRKIAEHWVSGRTVIDIGCSLGVGSNILSHSARFVWGIDVNVEAVNFARLAYTRPNLDFEIIDIENPPTRELAHFEVVVACEVMEHLGNWEAGIGTIKRFFNTKLGTTGFITTPNVANPEVVANEAKHGFHLQHYSVGEFYQKLINHFDSVTLYSVDKLNKWEAIETVDGNSTDYLVVAKVQGAKT